MAAGRQGAASLHYKKQNHQTDYQPDYQLRADNGVSA
jgi:hypothetical protein